MSQVGPARRFRVVEGTIFTWGAAWFVNHCTSSWAELGTPLVDAADRCHAEDTDDN